MEVRRFLYDLSMYDHKRHHFTVLYQVQVFQLKRSEDEKTHSILMVLCYVL